MAQCVDRLLSLLGVAVCSLLLSFRFMYLFIILSRLFNQRDMLEGEPQKPQEHHHTPTTNEFEEIKIEAK